MTTEYPKRKEQKQQIVKMLSLSWRVTAMRKECLTKRKERLRQAPDSSDKRSCNTDEGGAIRRVEVTYTVAPHLEHALNHATTGGPHRNVHGWCGMQCWTDDVMGGWWVAPLR